MIKAVTFETKPCKNCGGTKRYISNRNCPTCQHEAQRRYKARKTGVEPRRRKSYRVAAPNPVEAATAPYSALQSILEYLIYLPIFIFHSVRKYTCTL